MDSIVGSFEFVYLNPGDILYRQGQDSVTFFIVWLGELQMDTLFEFDHFNQNPIGENKWEVVKTT